VAIITDEQGNKSSLMECPHCGVYEMHQAMPDREGTFQCRLCFAMFRDDG
jgi:formylmethanofuran dehydrogenase subunit E